MTYSDILSIVLRMIAEGSEPHEIFEQLSKFGLSSSEIDEIYDAVLEMVVNGYEKTEMIIDNSYDIRRRVFVDDELETLKMMPGLFKSFVKGDISPGDFEKSLSDFSVF
ncbi:MULTISPECIES: hypothetical protein [Kosmotoga]|uniref:Uncharacterized protein n=1 Tax=Kosmotoga olearia (strain ATCC BAA-1733 / DSM 21960 / TBF 19.5.1) TaxID=521045 RepID=C5CIX7_KOSOT|nr:MULTISPECIES: hypothetical protein [Kosmotoga]ACR78966.1 hypothetical protein Kole_0241 [Kosmotoga olearia TBF 19.5.1]MDK2953903.1 hypothetical protein [Kosmotoga sp.]OAA24273.1 hypothetical protein DU53_01130 [Kosmotoga sp. DU53]